MSGKGMPYADGYLSFAKGGGRSPTVLFVIDAPRKEALDALCAREGVSRGQVLRALVDAELRRLGLHPDQQGGDVPGD